MPLVLGCPHQLRTVQPTAAEPLGSSDDQQPVEEGFPVNLLPARNASWEVGELSSKCCWGRDGLVLGGGAVSSLKVGRAVSVLPSGE